MTHIESIIERDMRILPSDQDRSKKIESIIPADMRIFNFENDFNMTIRGSVNSGSYGEIFSCSIKITGQPVILKKFQNYSKINGIISEDMIKEIAFIQLLNKFPNTKVVVLYGIAISTNLQNVYLVMEPLEKSLNDIKRQHFPAEQLRIIFYQLIKAFYNIHGVGVIHNDIKLGNIMIHKNDIRIIDFGISEYLGVGSSKELVIDYICTEITKAPDSEDQVPFGFKPPNRKTYASDMYSIGATLVQLAIKSNDKLRVKDDKIYSADIKGKIIRDLTDLLRSPDVYGPDGYDLLLKIMNPNTHIRWCTIKALIHPYFYGIPDYIPIDRKIIRGGYIEKMYDDQIQYSEEEYQSREMELCYLEIQHQTFIDDIIPMKIIASSTLQMYLIVIDWMFSVYTASKLIDGLEPLINDLCIINNKWGDVSLKYGASHELQMLGILSNHISRSIYNNSEKHIDFYSELCQNCCTTERCADFILNDLIINNHCKISIYPISIHVQYIYLKLRFVLKDARINDDNVLKQLFIDIYLHIIFWLIQPVPFHMHITTWEIVIFNTNRVLSMILQVPFIELNSKPLLNFLTLDDHKFAQMNQYFNSSVTDSRILRLLKDLPELSKLFYNNPIFTANPM